MKLSKEFYGDNKPLEWQEKFVEIFDKHGSAIAHAEAGSGKTFAAIQAYRLQCMKEKRLLNTIIYTPLITLRNWKEEFLKFSKIKEKDIVIVTGTKAKKLKALDSGSPKIYITNYETVISKEAEAALSEMEFDFAIFDEMHYCKTHNSKRSKSILRLTESIPHKIQLTGTPLLNNAADLYMQYRIFDGGETFGKSFYTFRSMYMEDQNAHFAHLQNHFPKWVTKKSMYEVLHAKMYAKGIRVLKKDCLSLPPLVKQSLLVPMSSEQKKHYKHMKRDFITFIEDNNETKAVVATVAATKALRLMQICSGHMIDEEGGTIDLGMTPKYKACKDKLEQILQQVGSQVILWCSFKHDYVTLAKMCKELNEPYSMITGAMSSTQKFDDIELFNTAKTRIMIANRRAGGIGINLVGANYSIVWSRNFSLGEEIQSEARNYRRGSERHESITKYDLVCEDSIEQHVMESLQGKKDLSKNVIDLVKAL